mmetsp:Transcript_24999/g.58663  ORF Transcript_24999/g.58663 Transcript_24999/m.58663 type:complete len:602 (-) Transcript_24999:23-1828(-)
MVENNPSFVSLSYGEAVRLDSTKRCLFPIEDELSRSGSDSTKTSTEIDAKNTEVSIHNLKKETLESPISVVCVHNSGNPTINSKSYESVNTLLSSTLLHTEEISSCDDVQEQTIIEVQYIEAGDQIRDIYSVENSQNEKKENIQKHKNYRDSPLNRKDAARDFGYVRAKPLLDIEKTPSRSQTKSEKNSARTPVFGCGDRGLCLSACNDSGHQLVERKITTFLEDSSVSTPDMLKSACTDWQAWSYFGLGRNKSPTDIVKQNPSKEKIRSNLRRRTSHNVRVRKSNIRQLKQNLAPFAQSPARSPARAPDLFRNRSFSVSDHRSAILRVSEEKNSATGSFSDVLQLCTMYENIHLDSPDLLMKHKSAKVNAEDLSYDSDPEDFIRRRRSSSHIEKSEYQEPFTSPSRSLLDVHNDELFSNIIQEIFNKTTTLVLHPLMDCTKPESVKSLRPIAVDAWLERGQHLAHALIQPKWIWKAKSHLNADGQSNIRQKFCLRGIELLDITRILKMEETDKGSQSFAKQGHSFFVKSIHDEEFCFEAKSRTERDRVVSSLKLLIARFGAKVLTGDPQVYYDFFWTNDVAPGKAPELHEVFSENMDGFR